MDGEEIPEDRDALSRCRPWLANLAKLACGAGVGLIVAFVLVLIVSALR